MRRMVILTEHDRVPCAREADTEVGHDEDEVLSSNDIKTGRLQPTFWASPSVT